ncbi:hypothetical protein PHPALM_30592 [Phytophthora palmivora]|uniref:Uncharacterized protein n=1 Tax=Phytophthora palmivora TaxID=4796 RepID=A0A2P4X4R0_9STRA|nr:hypothetical protein PHPALM_30592 [Phytophthora palmivora]
MAFFLTFERALKTATEVTGIVMTDEHKALNFYNAMPSTWKPDLAIWKGNKKFIPYTDVKTNIDHKVLDDYAKRKYEIKKGSSESPATASETALLVIANLPQRPKRLRTGTVKEGTVQPANVAIIDRKPRDNHNPFPAKQQRTQRPDGRRRPPSRGENGLNSPDI